MSDDPLTLVTSVRPIARQHHIEGLDGLRLGVIIYKDGGRDLMVLTDDDDEPAAVFRLTEDQARLLATVLSFPGA